MKLASGKTTWLPWACALLFPASAHAVIVMANSIEWVLATSDRVVVGKVIKIGEIPPVIIRERPAKAIIDFKNKKWRAITVAISRTLKGAHSERATFLMPDLADGRGVPRIVVVGWGRYTLDRFPCATIRRQP